MLMVRRIAVLQDEKHRKINVLGHGNHVKTGYCLRKKFKVLRVKTLGRAVAQGAKEVERVERHRQRLDDLGRLDSETP